MSYNSIYSTYEIKDSISLDSLNRTEASQRLTKSIPADSSAIDSSDNKSVDSYNVSFFNVSDITDNTKDFSKSTIIREELESSLFSTDENISEEDVQNSISSLADNAKDSLLAQSNISNSNALFLLQ